MPYVCVLRFASQEVLRVKSTWYISCRLLLTCTTDLVVTISLRPVTAIMISNYNIDTTDPRSGDTSSVCRSIHRLSHFNYEHFKSGNHQYFKYYPFQSFLSKIIILDMLSKRHFTFTPFNRYTIHVKNSHLTRQHVLKQRHFLRDYRLDLFLGLIAHSTSKRSTFYDTSAQSETTSPIKATRLYIKLSY